MHDAVVTGVRSHKSALPILLVAVRTGTSGERQLAPFFTYLHLAGGSRR